MDRSYRRLVIALVALVAAVAGFVVLAEIGAFNTEVWVRESPLIGAIKVTGVQDGVISLADGRALTPAGVVPCNGVSVEQYDEALRVMVAQGVVVMRDLGDGRAFLLVEPKFYNWCGTRGYEGNPWAHWAGIYLPAPLCELLVQTGYAQYDPDEPGLTARERWRLEGVPQLGGVANSPVRISSRLVALQYDSQAHLWSDYEAFLEAVWKPAPSP
jgi:hypothetical protein